jgi:hypothetical protein
MMCRKKPARKPREPEARKRLSRKKTRANRSTRKDRRQAANGLRPLSVVDHLVAQENGTFAVPVKGQCFYEPSTTVRDLGSFTPHEGTYYQLGIYSRNELCLRETTNPNAALNKAAKIFGPIARERHFRFALRCIVVEGISRRRFKSLMRIRDLAVRGNNRSFKKHIKRYVFGFPEKTRELASELHYPE